MAHVCFDDSSVNTTKGILQRSRPSPLFYEWLLDTEWRSVDVDQMLKLEGVMFKEKVSEIIDEKKYGRLIKGITIKAFKRVLEEVKGVCGECIYKLVEKMKDRSHVTVSHLPLYMTGWIYERMSARDISINFEEYTTKADVVNALENLPISKDVTDVILRYLKSHSHISLQKTKGILRLITSPTPAEYDEIKKANERIVKKKTQKTQKKRQVPTKKNIVSYKYIDRVARELLIKGYDLEKAIKDEIYTNETIDLLVEHGIQVSQTLYYPIGKARKIYTFCIHNTICWSENDIDIVVVKKDTSESEYRFRSRLNLDECRKPLSDDVKEGIRNEMGKLVSIDSIRGVIPEALEEKYDRLVHSFTIEFDEKDLCLMISIHCYFKRCGSIDREMCEIARGLIENALPGIEVGDDYVVPEVPFML